MGAAYLRRYIASVTPDAAPDPPVRPASTVILVRPGAPSLEVLMVRRGGDAQFMRNARVFPGGTVCEEDRGPAAVSAVRWSGAPDELPWRAAALRELAEEAGVLLTDPPGVDPGPGPDLFAAVLRSGAALDADRLLYLSNWVTPKGPPRRYDTRFYVAMADEGAGALADDREVFDARWVSPAEALALGESGAWEVELPTRKHLELLAGLHSARAVLDYAVQRRPIARIEPRVHVAHDGSWKVVLPGEPGYEEALR
jgi:8-oxo-dGTP pyrophosphatase MutT (NUDIX family)